MGVGALVANCVVACSSDSTDGGFTVEDDSGTHPVLPESGALGDATPPSTDANMPGMDAQPGDATMPMDSSVDTGVDAAADARVDTGVDAGTDAGATGTACAPNGSIGTEACGFCGFHTRLCAPNSGGGTPVWQAWGFCQSEVVGGCTPGTMTTETCGNCGTRMKACQVDCSYAVGACTGQPVGACAPGSVDFELGLSCSAGQGRTRTCGAACTYNAFGACSAPSTSLTLVATVGAKVTGQFKLVSTATQTRAGTGSCPTTLSSTVTPYSYVVLDNTTTKTLKVSVWGSTSTVAGAPAAIDTVMAAYAGGTAPTTDAARKACLTSVNDGCDDPLGDGTACNDSWAGLFDDDAVTVAPGAKVTIYTAGYFSSGVGDYQLTARTETVGP